MRANYMEYRSPQFRILSDKQLEEIHLASLQILERTGVSIQCNEALDLLDGAGADASDTGRVRVPSFLVERALRLAPKTITLYTRDGEPAIVLNGMTSHFGGINSTELYLEPTTGKPRPCFAEDIGSMARLIDGLPNVEWSVNVTSCSTIPGAIADKISLVQSLLNTSKPIASCSNDASSLEEILDLCAMVAGGEKNLRDKPFFVSTAEPVSPLVHSEESLKKSLLCAENGVPNFVFSAPMAGATAPATLPAVLALLNAEFLSHLVIIQLKKPGAPVIYGGHPTILDMKTCIFSYGAPESALLIASLTELGHYYRLPVFGTAGEVDAMTIDAQAATEATIQIMLSSLSGADFVHGIGEMYHGKMMSPELVVLCSEIIEMCNVVMKGLEISEETLPLDLIDKVGPKGNYLLEKHTFAHFHEFWTPTVFNRSAIKTPEAKGCADMLREKTIHLMKTHQPKPLSNEIVRELKRFEAGWLKRVGLKEYPKNG